MNSVTIEFSPDRENSTIDVEARVKVTAKTGVEMEALTAVSVTCLTIYDMLKAVDRAMVISDIKLMEKSGGRSGHFVRSSIFSSVLGVSYVAGQGNLEIVDLGNDELREVIGMFLGHVVTHYGIWFTQATLRLGVKEALVLEQGVVAKTFSKRHDQTGPAF